MTKKITTFNINEEIAIKLELVSRLLNKSKSQIVNELLEKGLVTEAILEEVRTQEVQKKIAEECTARRKEKSDAGIMQNCADS